MFISVGYLLLYLYRFLRGETPNMRYLRLLHANLDSASVVFRNLSHVVQGSAQMDDPVSRLVQKCSAGWVENILMQTHSKQILAVSPKMSLSLRQWTSYLDKQNYPVQPCTREPGVCHVLFETHHTDDMDDFLQQSFSIPQNKRVKVADCVIPLAWRAGSPFGIVAECTVENLATLANAFMESTLMLDDMLELNQILSVELEGHAANLLRVNSNPSTPFHVSPLSSNVSVHQSYGEVLEEGEVPSAEVVEQDFYEGSNESLASSLCDPQEGFSRLEGQGESGAGSEGVMDLTMDSLGGEAPSGPLEELAPEALTPIKRVKANQNKPPNVLIYCGKKDSARLFEAVKSIIQNCLNLDKYVIYNLKHEQVLTTPWADNTVMLIISSEKAYDGTDQAFLKYFQAGGTVVSFSSAFDSLFLERLQTGNTVSVLSLNYKHWTDVTMICGRHEYCNCDSRLPDINVRNLAINRVTGNPVMVEATHDISEGVALLAQVNLDKDPVELAINPEIFAALKKANAARFEILADLFTMLGLDCSQNHTLTLTPARLFTVKQSQKASFIKSLESRLKDGKTLRSRNLSLHFLDGKMTTHESPVVTDDSLPVYLTPEGQTDSVLCHFNFEAYKKHLATKVLGQVVMCADVMVSTMNVFDGLMFSIPEDIGLVAIAGLQTNGKGRGGNAWLSPDGCAMFSIHVRLPMSSRLGQRVSYLQHVAALAVVQAVVTLPGYEALDLRLKWPNDIYFGNTMKMGGVLVQSTVMRDTIHAIIGCGINVSNKNPTVCVNDLIEQHNKQMNTELEPLSREVVVARTLNMLELLIADFQTRGQEAFLPLYYTRWLHSDALIRLDSETGPSVKIIGLDDYGYLAVRTGEGKVISLQPDGNSFDMMRHLVYKKSR